MATVGLFSRAVEHGPAADARDAGLAGGPPSQQTTKSRTWPMAPFEAAGGRQGPLADARGAGERLRAPRCS